MSFLLFFGPSFVKKRTSNAPSAAAVSRETLPLPRRVRAYSALAVLDDGTRFSNDDTATAIKNFGRKALRLLRPESTLEQARRFDEGQTSVSQPPARMSDQEMQARIMQARMGGINGLMP